MKKMEPQCWELKVMNTKIDDQAVLVLYWIIVLFPGEKRPHDLKDLLTGWPPAISQTSETQIKGNLGRFGDMKVDGNPISNHGSPEKALRAYFMQFDFYQNLQVGNYTNLISQTNVTC